MAGKYIDKIIVIRKNHCDASMNPVQRRFRGHRSLDSMARGLRFLMQGSWRAGGDFVMHCQPLRCDDMKPAGLPATDRAEVARIDAEFLLREQSQIIRGVVVRRSVGDCSGLRSVISRKGKCHG